MKESWLDKHQMKIFWFTWGLIIACCIFIFFSNTAHAATGTTVLPYITTNNFNSISQDEVNTVLDKISQTYPEADFSKIIVFKTGEGAWWTWSEYATVPAYTVYSFSSDYAPNTVWNGPNLSSSTFSNFELFNSQYSISVNLDGVVTYTYMHREIGDFVDKINNGSSNYRSFFGDNTITSIQSPVTFTYNANYPVYCNFQLKAQDSVLNQGIIVSPGGGNSDILSGHATQPINDPDNLIGGIDGHPVPKPDAPTIQTYVPPAPQFPQIDTSTLESLLESLIDVVVYGFSYLKDILSGFFSNLLNNLQEIAEYLSQSIYYAANKIVKSLQDLATDFYNNMVSLFEPLLNGITEMISGIKDRIDYFFEEFDSTGAIEYYENNCSFYTLSTMSFGFISDLHTGLSGVQAPQRLVFHIDFSNAPFPFNTVGTLDINFDWYEGLRHTIVPWILVFLYFGVLYSFVMQIPNIIHGTSGLFSPHLTETNTITAIETSSSNGYHYTDSYSTVVKSYSSIFGSFSRATSSNSNVSRRKK